MSLRDVGSGPAGFFKALVWSVLFGVVGLGIGLPLSVVVGKLLGATGTKWYTQPGLPQAAAQGTALVVSFALATWLVGVKAVRQSWESLRWRGAGRPFVGFEWGSVLGISTAAGAMALGLLVAGAGWSTDGGSWLEWGWAVVASVAALALPALSEEIIFRGVPLVLLAGVIGRWPAVVVTALAFGLFHLGNPDVTPLGIVNITLAGVFLGAAFYAPGGIWTAWGAHLGWNVAIAALGAPVSGLPLGIPHLAYDPGGPAWLSGGAFGPEGGLLATLTTLAGIAVLARWRTSTEAVT